MTWLNLTMPNQTVKSSIRAKKIELPQMNFVLEKQLIKFSCTYEPLSICKIFIKKNLRVDLEFWGCAPFLGPKQPICPEQNFFGYKPLLSLSSTYGPFHCAKFKRNHTMDPELWRCTIFGPKVVHLPLIIFFSENLLMNLVSFIHAFLHAKNQSQILIY